MSRVVALAAGLAGAGFGLAGCDGLLQEPDSGFAKRPVHLEVVTGDGQTGTAGEALAAPLRVRLMGAEGIPLSRVRVEWSAGPGSGRAEPRNSFSNAEGIAETRWTLGPSPGVQELRARLGSEDVVVFHATGSP